VLCLLYISDALGFAKLEGVE